MPLTHVQLSDGGRYRWPPQYPAVETGALRPSATLVASDILTAPSAEILARQVQKLAPRGRAWNSDETEAPWGSKRQHGVWSLIGEGARRLYLAATRALESAFPGSASDEALTEWESQLGLPDPCSAAPSGLSARRQAVQVARTRVEGASRLDMLVLLARSGASPLVDIKERRGLECGWSGCGEDGFEGPDDVHKFFVSGPVTYDWIACGDHSLETPMGVVSTDLSLCALERAKHAHTRAIFEPMET